MIQCQPDPGTVGQHVHHAAGGIQNIRTAQLHVGVVLHGRKPLCIAVAHTVHGLGSADARLDLESDLVHKAFVFQHHALEQEDGLLRGAAAVCHAVQLTLGCPDSVFQQALFPFRVERPGRKIFVPALQPAHLSHHKARRGAVSLIDLHSSITSGSIGPVRARQTNACKNVLGSRAARAACAALPLPSNRGAKLSMRSRSHFFKKASASVRVV